jgi:hypothetical protein
MFSPYKKEGQVDPLTAGLLPNILTRSLLARALSNLMSQETDDALAKRETSTSAAPAVSESAARTKRYWALAFS